jgi:uncharacterized protein YbjT (DUF2867 family)
MQALQQAQCAAAARVVSRRRAVTAAPAAAPRAAAAAPARHVAPHAARRRAARCAASTPSVVAAGSADASVADAPAATPSGPLPVVFVAGATGRTGVRVVRELAAAGYTVRAGVRNTAKAAGIFRGVDVPSGVGYTGARAPPAALDTTRVTAVQCDVTNPATLPAALGDATVVISCLGAPESEAFNPSLPRAVDGDGACALVAAAAASGRVRHFIMVSSLGTGKFGWPASILNLFWSVLEHKARAEDALIASGLPFTIVRPGGMERPTDDYADTHGMVLCREDTRFGGQVSRAQVAQLCAAAVAAPDAAANKVLEVVAEEGMPLRPLARQMEALPVRVRGVPAPDGSATAFTARYAYTPDATTRFLDIMSFGGAAPETINGRVAMIAVLGALWVEAHGGGTLAAQAANTASLHPWPEVIAAGVTAASLPPMLRRVSPTDAQAGPFRAATETLHGRMAMVGLSLMAVLEAAHGMPVWEHPWPFY